MLGKILSPHEAKAYAVLRIVSGLCFVTAGLPKLVPLMPSYPVAEVGSQMWFGGCIEVIGGLLVMIGLFTVIAAFICSGEMAVAYIQFHWKFQFNSQFFPTTNQGLSALLLCFIFLYIACRGAGIWSVDSRRG
ncbi:MAG: DoxX family protein [Myxococcota bacterium]|nr:DoxX family protein [Myxococcota bacterium]